MLLNFIGQAFPSVYWSVEANAVHADLTQQLAAKHPEIILVDMHPGLDGEHDKFVDLVHLTQPGDIKLPRMSSPEYERSSKRICESRPRRSNHPVRNRAERGWPNRSSPTSAMLEFYYIAVYRTRSCLGQPRSGRLLLLCLFRPGVFQRDRAIENRFAGLTVLVQREIGQALELIAHPGSASFRLGSHFAVTTSSECGFRTDLKSRPPFPVPAQ